MTTMRYRLPSTALVAACVLLAGCGVLTDEKSDEIVKASQKLVSKRHDLNKKTHKNVRKVLSGPRAARFYQVQGQIQTLIDLQIQTELPLVEVPEPAPDAGSEGME